jgi:uncharacterized membrane protein
MVESQRMAGRLQLNPHLAGALAYVIGPLALLLRRDHAIVRFHALQASLLALSLAVVNLSLWILLAAIYRQSWYAGEDAKAVFTLIYRAQLVLWLVMLYSGYELSKVRLPWVGEVAERL